MLISMNLIEEHIYTLSNRQELTIKTRMDFSFEVLRNTTHGAANFWVLFVGIYAEVEDWTNGLYIVPS